MARGRGRRGGGRGRGRGGGRSGGAEDDDSDSDVEVQQKLGVPRGAMQTPDSLCIRSGSVCLQGRMQTPACCLPVIARMKVMTNQSLLRVKAHK